MGTHAFICKKTPNGYLGIQLHYDGYFSHAGKILLHFYNTPEKVDELIKLGNLSTLGETRETTVTQTDNKETYEQNKPQLFWLRPTANKRNHNVYIFDEDNQWYHMQYIS